MNLRGELSTWLASIFPEASRVDLRFRDPWTGSDGLTLGRTIWLRPAYESRLAALDPAAIELLCHELVHVEQFAAAGFWWPLVYLFRHRRMEAEAYQRARELRALWEAQ